MNIHNLSAENETSILELERRALESKWRAEERARERYFGSRMTHEENLAIEDARHFIEAQDFSSAAIGRLDGHAWAQIVSLKPEYAVYCPFERFDSADWIMVLARHPELSKGITLAGFERGREASECREKSFITQTDVLEPYGRLKYVVEKDGEDFDCVTVTGICDYPCHVDYLKIPSVIDGYKVFAIRSLSNNCATSCQGCAYLEEVEISEGVRAIGDYAFKGMDIQKLILPNSVVSIAEHAFDEMDRSREDYGVRYRILHGKTEIGGTGYER